MTINFNELKRSRLLNEHFISGFVVLFIGTNYLLSACLTHLDLFPQNSEEPSFLFASTFEENSLRSWLFSILWLGLIAARALFIASPLQAGPLSRLLGHKISSPDGRRPTIGQAIAYVFWEFLPINLIAFSKLIWGFPPPPYNVLTNLTGYYGLVFCFLWLLPFYSFRSSMRLSFSSWATCRSGLQLEWRDHASKKFQKAYEKPWRQKFFNAILPYWRFIDRVLTTLVIGCFLLVMVQIVRDPKLPSDYFETFHAKDNLRWNDNGYFALQGLNAPPFVKDTYTYGRNTVFTAFILTESIKHKGANGTLPLYTVPDIKAPENFVAYPKTERLEFDISAAEDTSKISCRSIKHKDQDAPCMNGKTVQKIIAQNKTLWNRMNSLPDYNTFEAIPIDLQGSFSGQSLINLSRIKVANLLEIAHAGQSDQAVREWLRFMTLEQKLNRMANITLVERAIHMVSLGLFLNAYQDLILIDPTIASKYKDQIDPILSRSAPELYQSNVMWARDWGLIESALLKTAGTVMPPSTGFRQKLLKCDQKQKSYLKDHAHSGFTIQEYGMLCDQIFSMNKLVTNILSTSGEPVSNTIFFLLVNGTIRGFELVDNMYLRAGTFRMARLATQILADKIPEKDIQAYLDHAPDDLRNPYSGLPFLWDDKEKSLYFLDNNAETRSFYLKPKP